MFEPFNSYPGMLEGISGMRLGHSCGMSNSTERQVMSPTLPLGSVGISSHGPFDIKDLDATGCISPRQLSSGNSSGNPAFPFTPPSAAEHPHGPMGFMMAAAMDLHGAASSFLVRPRSGDLFLDKALMCLTFFPLLELFPLPEPCG